METSESTIDGMWTYNYDADGELMHAVFAPNNSDPDGLTAQNLIYNYDAMGNRTSTLLNGVTTVYTVNDMNEYTSVGGIGYTYDADGNLVSDGTILYNYNAVNQLISLNGPAGATTYSYTGLGQLSASSTNGGTTDYLVDPFGLGNIDAEFGPSRDSSIHYVYGLNLICQYMNGGENDLDYYYDFDSADSTNDLTSINGNEISKYNYLPFGNVLGSVGETSNPFLFDGAGGAITITTNISVDHTRLLFISIGRFGSTDPSNIPGLNQFSYALNNPINLIDLSGKNPYSCTFNNKWGLDGMNFPLNTPEVNPLPGQSFEDQQDEANWQGFVKAYAAPAYLVDGAIVSVATEAVATAVGLADAEASFFSGLTNTLPSFPTSVPEAAGDIVQHIVEAILPGGSNSSEGSTAVANSHDPNAKIGPDGYNTASYVADNGIFPYRIDFENASNASAPAQEVTIIDQLSSNINWNSFQLTQFGFGDFNLTVPANTQRYQATVQMTYDGETFDVQIVAGIRTGTGLVYADFYSVNPITGLPPDVLVGFLPPEDGTGRGEGYVSYTVQPKAGLPTGTQITNVAEISFNEQPYIATDEVNDDDLADGTDPTKMDLVTIDSVPPTSSVSALPSQQASPSINLTWSGQDDTGGSGVASYTIYVSVNGGAYTPWLTNTNTISGTFTGAAGNTYSFYSIATDNGGNVQPTPTSPQATTTIIQGFALNLSGNNFYLKLDANGTQLDIWDGTTDSGPLGFSALISELSSVSLSGIAGNDSVTVDMSDGDPLASSGLTFTGSTGGQNTLTVIGTTGNDTVTSTSSQFTIDSVGISLSNVSNVFFTPGSGADTLSVNSGTVTLTNGSGPAITTYSFSNISIAAGAKLAVASTALQSERTLLKVQTLSIAGSTSAWTGTLDLGGNDMDISGSTIATITNQLESGYANGNWNGTGIDSSAAHTNSSHLTALGSLLNDGGGTTLYGAGGALGQFDGTNPGATDVLLKYTYYGDSNLDGKVDGTDYGRIDNAYLADRTRPGEYTGWANGDFNYDGTIDGSDYTLIDNAFNTQGAKLAAQIASAVAVPTTEIAVSGTDIPTGTIPRSSLHRPIVSRKRNPSGKSASFVPNVFSTGTPISFTESSDGGIELSMKKKDLLDSLMI